MRLSICPQHCKIVFNLINANEKKSGGGATMAGICSIESNEK